MVALRTKGYQDYVTFYKLSIYLQNDSQNLNTYYHTIAIVFRSSSHQVHRTSRESTQQQNSFNLPPEIALHSETHDCSCFDCLTCLFQSCIRLDCVTDMTLFQAISRYEEEFMIPTNVSKIFFMLTL